MKKHEPVDIIAFAVRWIFTPKHIGFVLNNSSTEKKIKNLIKKIYGDLANAPEVEHIPIIPPKIRKVIKYPFRTMDIGESFFTTNQYQVVQNSVNRMHQISSKQFEIRREKNGTRVWRIK